MPTTQNIALSSAPLHARRDLAQHITAADIPVIKTASDYAGDITPQTAWRVLLDDKDAHLIDVRTQAEWAFVGIPDIDETGKQVWQIEWQRFPAMSANADFVENLQNAVPDKMARLMFLCRSGGRSKAAACLAQEQGYASAYNIAGGFEGDVNAAGHRGTVNGWKVAGLPWRQR